MHGRPNRNSCCEGLKMPFVSMCSTIFFWMTFQRTWWCVKWALWIRSSWERLWLLPCEMSDVFSIRGIWSRSRDFLHMTLILTVLLQHRFSIAGTCLGLQQQQVIFLWWLSRYLPSWILYQVDVQQCRHVGFLWRCVRSSQCFLGCTEDTTVLFCQHLCHLKGNCDEVVSDVVQWSDACKDLAVFLGIGEKVFAIDIRSKCLICVIIY